jgi:WD repeat-containing protein 53
MTRDRPFLYTSIWLKLGIAVMPLHGTHSPEQISVSKLKGHKKAVLCLDHSSSVNGSGGGLVSGSEDATIRFWDLRTNRRSDNAIPAALCIPTPDEVLAVSFGPQPRLSIQSTRMMHTTTTQERTSEPSAHRDYTIFAAIGRSVVAYDLRHTVGIPVWSSHLPDFDYSPILNVHDDVNRIVFTSTDSSNSDHDSKGGRPLTSPESYMAVASDDGTVRLTNYGFTSSSSYQTRTMVHATAASPSLVLSCSFRPDPCKVRQNMIQAASGGSDCTLRLWSLSSMNANKLQAGTKGKSRRARRGKKNSNLGLDDTSSTMTIKTPTAHATVSRNDTGTNQVCNPPMVHGVEWSPSGKLLVGCAGDGTAVVYEVVENNLLLLRTRLDPSAVTADSNGTSHMLRSTGSLANAIFPQWTTGHAVLHAESLDRLLATVGNDTVIRLWDLGAGVAGVDAIDPRNLFGRHSTQFEAATLGSQFENLMISSNPTILTTIQHGRKPNWMVSSRGAPSVFASTLFVADTTPVINAYTMLRT